MRWNYGTQAWRLLAYLFSFLLSQHRFMCACVLFDMHYCPSLLLIDCLITFYANAPSSSLSLSKWICEAKCVCCATFPWFSFNESLPEVPSKKHFGWSFKLFLMNFSVVSLHYSMLSFDNHVGVSSGASRNDSLCNSLIYFMSQVIILYFVCFGRSQQLWQSSVFLSSLSKIVSFAQQRIIQHLTLGGVETL